MVTSILSKSASSFSTSSTSSSSLSPIVKLYSLKSILQNNQHEYQTKNLRVVHFIRHAEGYHNVNKDYKNPAHIDAQLTPHGINQCHALSRKLQLKLNESKIDNNHDDDDDIPGNLLKVECIVSSPMRRAIQTAQYSFQHQLELQPNYNNNNNNNKSLPTTKIPFVACEAWRETVNYLCDKRLTKTQLQQSYAFVNFDQIHHEEDPIWDKYEQLCGMHDEYTTTRESIDDVGLRQRAIQAWEFLIHERQERNIAVVSHSAFFMHMFTRKEIGAVAYADEDVESLMTAKGFENCEMRSVAFEIL